MRTITKNKVIRNNYTFKYNIKLKEKNKNRKSDLMKIIREHIPADHIKAANEDLDLKKHHSRFNLPYIKCPSNNSNKVIKRYFHRGRFKRESSNDFKRNTANHLVLKVFNTPKKVLLNYPSYKYFEKHGKAHPNYQYLCEFLVSNHLATAIANRRAAWINIFFYNFHKIGDFSKALISKSILTENDQERLEALLGITCNQRGTEPYFPCTSFVSGKQYDYSRNKHLSEVTADTNNDMDIGDDKQKVTKDNTKSKGMKTDKTKSSFSKTDSKLYLCTDDCIRATDKEYKSFLHILETFNDATDKNIRSTLENFDKCSNMKLDDIYLLPREKRNHPKICYESTCQGYSVLVRKLAIHYKNCRILKNYFINLNTAHQFIHDIDAATVLGDIDYLIKLLALPTENSPSVLCTSNFPPSEKKDYAIHIAMFHKRCLDLPDTVCQSCDMLVSKQNDVVYPKESWVNVKSAETNAAWNQFKDMLGITIF